jgi:hypothetical protein
MFYENIGIRRPISGLKSTLTEKFTRQESFKSAKSGVASKHVYWTDIKGRTAVVVVKRVRHFFIVALSYS